MSFFLAFYNIDNTDLYLCLPSISYVTNNSKLKTMTDQCVQKSQIPIHPKRVEILGGNSTMGVMTVYGIDDKDIRGLHFPHRWLGPLKKIGSISCF